MCIFYIIIHTRPRGSKQEGKKDGQEERERERERERRVRSSLWTGAGLLPLFLSSRNDPHGIGRAEALWNSFSCDHSIAVLQSVPAFPLSQASVGPRSSGEVAQQHASARSNQRFVNSFLCLNLLLSSASPIYTLAGLTTTLRGAPLLARRLQPAVS
jgi:hypothetical protein